MVPVAESEGGTVPVLSCLTDFGWRTQKMPGENFDVTYWLIILGGVGMYASLTFEWGDGERCEEAYGG